MRNGYNSKGCASWNCCDDTLEDNINRCNYVKNVREQLKKKRLETKASEMRSFGIKQL